MAKNKTSAPASSGTQTRPSFNPAKASEMRIRAFSQQVGVALESMEPGKYTYAFRKATPDPEQNDLVTGTLDISWETPSGETRTHSLTLRGLRPDSMDQAPLIVGGKVSPVSVTLKAKTRNPGIRSGYHNDLLEAEAQAHKNRNLFGASVGDSGLSGDDFLARVTALSVVRAGASADSVFHEIFAELTNPIVAYDNTGPVTGGAYTPGYAYIIGKNEESTQASGGLMQIEGRDYALVETTTESSTSKRNSTVVSKYMPVNMILDTLGLEKVDTGNTGIKFFTRFFTPSKVKAGLSRVFRSRFYEPGNDTSLTYRDGQGNDVPIPLLPGFGVTVKPNAPARRTYDHGRELVFGVIDSGSDQAVGLGLDEGTAIASNVQLSRGALTAVSDAKYALDSAADLTTLKWIGADLNARSNPNVRKGWRDPMDIKARTMSNINVGPNESLLAGHAEPVFQYDIGGESVKEVLDESGYIGRLVKKRYFVLGQNREALNQSANFLFGNEGVVTHNGQQLSRMEYFQLVGAENAHLAKLTPELAAKRKTLEGAWNERVQQLTGGNASNFEPVFPWMEEHPKTTRGFGENQILIRYQGVVNSANIKFLSAKGLLQWAKGISEHLGDNTILVGSKTIAKGPDSIQLWHDYWYKNDQARADSYARRFDATPDKDKLAFAQRELPLLEQEWLQTDSGKRWRQEITAAGINPDLVQPRHAITPNVAAEYGAQGNTTVMDWLQAIKAGGMTAALNKAWSESFKRSGMLGLAQWAIDPTGADATDAIDIKGYRPFNANLVESRNPKDRFFAAQQYLNSLLQLQHPTLSPKDTRGRMFRLTRDDGTTVMVPSPADIGRLSMERGPVNNYLALLGPATGKRLQTTIDDLRYDVLQHIDTDSNRSGILKAKTAGLYRQYTTMEQISDASTVLLGPDQIREILQRSGDSLDADTRDNLEKLLAGDPAATTRFTGFAKREPYGGSPIGVNFQYDPEMMGENIGVSKWFEQIFFGDSDGDPIKIYLDNLKEQRKVNSLDIKRRAFASLALANGVEETAEWLSRSENAQLSNESEDEYLSRITTGRWGWDPALKEYKYSALNPYVGEKAQNVSVDRFGRLDPNKQGETFFFPDIITAIREATAKKDMGIYNLVQAIRIGFTDEQTGLGIVDQDQLLEGRGMRELSQMTGLTGAELIHHDVGKWYQFGLDLQKLPEVIKTLYNQFNYEALNQFSSSQNGDVLTGSILAQDAVRGLLFTRTSKKGNETWEVNPQLIAALYHDKASADKFGETVAAIQNARDQALASMKANGGVLKREENLRIYQEFTRKTGVNDRKNTLLGRVIDVSARIGLEEQIDKGFLRLVNVEDPQNGTTYSRLQSRNKDNPEEWQWATEGQQRLYDRVNPDSPEYRDLYAGIQVVRKRRGNVGRMLASLSRLPGPIGEAFSRLAKSRAIDWAGMEEERANRAAASSRVINNSAAGASSGSQPAQPQSGGGAAGGSGGGSNNILPPELPPDQLPPPAEDPSKLTGSPLEDSNIAGVDIETIFDKTKLRKTNSKANVQQDLPQGIWELATLAPGQNQPSVSHFGILDWAEEQKIANARADLTGMSNGQEPPGMNEGLVQTLGNALRADIKNAASGKTPLSAVVLTAGDKNNETARAQYQKFLDSLTEKDILVGHNILSFDDPVLQGVSDRRVYATPNTKATTFDTLELERALGTGMNHGDGGNKVPKGQSNTLQDAIYRRFAESTHSQSGNGVVTALLREFATASEDKWHDAGFDVRASKALFQAQVADAATLSVDTLRSLASQDWNFSHGSFASAIDGFNWGKDRSDRMTKFFNYVIDYKKRNNVGDRSVTSQVAYLANIQRKGEFNASAGPGNNYLSVPVHGSQTAASPQGGGPGKGNPKPSATAGTSGGPALNQQGRQQVTSDEMKAILAQLQAVVGGHNAMIDSVDRFLSRTREMTWGDRGSIESVLEEYKSGNYDKDIQVGKSQVQRSFKASDQLMASKGGNSLMDNLAVIDFGGSTPEELLTAANSMQSKAVSFMAQAELHHVDSGRALEMAGSIWKKAEEAKSRAVAIRKGNTTEANEYYSLRSQEKEAAGLAKIDARQRLLNETELNLRSQYESAHSVVDGRLLKSGDTNRFGETVTDAMVEAGRTAAPKLDSLDTIRHSLDQLRESAANTAKHITELGAVSKESAKQLQDDQKTMRLRARTADQDIRTAVAMGHLGPDTASALRAQVDQFQDISGINPEMRNAVTGEHFTDEQLDKANQALAMSVGSGSKERNVMAKLVGGQLAFQLARDWRLAFEPSLQGAAQQQQIKGDLYNTLAYSRNYGAGAVMQMGGAAYQAMQSGEIWDSNIRSARYEMVSGIAKTMGLDANSSAASNPNVGRAANSLLTGVGMGIATAVAGSALLPLAPALGPLIIPTAVIAGVAGAGIAASATYEGAKADVGARAAEWANGHPSTYGMSPTAAQLGAILKSQQGVQPGRFAGFDSSKSKEAIDAEYKKAQQRYNDLLEKRMGFFATHPGMKDQYEFDVELDEAKAEMNDLAKIAETDLPLLSAASVNGASLVYYASLDNPVGKALNAAGIKTSEQRMKFLADATTQGIEFFSPSAKVSDMANPDDLQNFKNTLPLTPRFQAEIADAGNLFSDEFRAKANAAVGSIYNHGSVTPGANLRSEDLFLAPQLKMQRGMNYERLGGETSTAKLLALGYTQEQADNYLHALSSEDKINTKAAASFTQSLQIGQAMLKFSRGNPASAIAAQQNWVTNQTVLNEEEMGSFLSFTQNDPTATALAAKMGVFLPGQTWHSATRMDTQTGMGLFQMSISGLSPQIDAQGFHRKQLPNGQMGPAIVSNASVGDIRTALNNLPGEKVNWTDRDIADLSGETYGTVGGVSALERTRTYKQFGFQFAELDVSRRQLEANRAFELAITRPQGDVSMALKGVSQFGGSMNYKGKDYNFMGSFYYQGAQLDWERAGIDIQYGRQKMEFGWQAEEMAISRTGTLMQRRAGAYDLAYQRREMDLSQQYAGEDYAFRKGRSALTHGWEMEDYERNIRRATGFEKQQLIRERGRNQELFGMDQGQVDKERKREQEKFAREDARWRVEQQRFQQNNHLEDQRWALEQKRFAEHKKFVDQDYAREVEAWGRKKAQFEEEKQIAEIQYDMDKERWKAEKDHSDAMYKLEIERIQLQGAQIAATEELTVKINKMMDDAMTRQIENNGLVLEDFFQNLKNAIQAAIVNGVFVAQHQLGPAGKDGKDTTNSNSKDREKNNTPPGKDKTPPGIQSVDIPNKGVAGTSSTTKTTARSDSPADVTVSSDNVYVGYVNIALDGGKLAQAVIKFGGPALKRSLRTYYGV